MILYVLLGFVIAWLVIKLKQEVRIKKFYENMLMEVFKKEGITNDAEINAR
jgi:hypothetical protein